MRPLPKDEWNGWCEMCDRDIPAVAVTLDTYVCHECVRFCELLDERLGFSVDEVVEAHRRSAA